MLTSWSVLIAVVGVIVLLGGGVAVLTVLLVRRSSGPSGPGEPVAAPGHAERNADAARLVAALDDAASRAAVTLEFARLQLRSDAPAELESTLAEARTAMTGLATVLAETRDGAAHGPEGTAVAGHLTAAIARAEYAHARLTAAQTRVERETREIDPPRAH